MPLCSFRPRLALLAGVAALVGGSLASSAAGHAAPYRGSSRDLGAHVSAATGQVLHLRIRSATLKAMRLLVVYLPAGYADPTNRRHRYPVLYLLSGAPGGADDWFWGMHAAQTLDRLIAARTVPPLILVSPDGNGGRLRDTQFVDSADGRQRVETFLVRDVLGYVDTHFRTVVARDGRGLVGYSAGAYGALNVGLHHPTLFGTLAGFCGYYTADPYEVSDPKLNHPMSTNPAFLHYNSPSITILHLHAAQRPAITLVESTIDGYYTGSTRQFDAELARHAIPHTTRLFAPRTAADRRTWPHSWSFVDYAFRATLPMIVAVFQRK